jgi:hypothetical protein
MSEKYIPKYLSEDIDHNVKDTPTVKKFQTNGKMASYLQDIYEYVHNLDKTTLLTSSTKPYKMGALKGIDIYVDPYMRWNDDRIIFFDENDNIVNEVVFEMNLYEEKSTNEERSNRLKMLLDDDVEETNKFMEEGKRLEELKRKANLDKIFREFVFNLLETHPEIKKIKVCPEGCSKLDLYELRKDRNNSEITTISFKIGWFKGEVVAEYDKKIFNDKLILYCDNTKITDEILFLDENDNEIYKTNMRLI